MRTLVILLVLAPVAASAVDERSPDEAIRRLVLAEPAAIEEPGATEWQGQPTWDAADSRTQRVLQQTARDLASARSVVESSGVVLRAERTTPAAYAFEGTQQGYPIVRAVWRDDFYRPTRTFQPAYWPHHVARSPVSFAAIEPVETGVLVHAPDRETARRLAALLWAQDYKGGYAPVHLLSERATEDDAEVRVARFTVTRDRGVGWEVTVWEWVLVADKRTGRVTRGAAVARAIPPPCPPLGRPAPGRTAEGLRLEVAIEPRAVTPVMPSARTHPPPADATITVTLSNPMSEDVYLLFADTRLNYRVSRADGQPAGTMYDPVVSLGMSSPMRVRAGEREEDRFSWVGRLDERTALPAGRYRVQALVGLRSCGPHSLREELSEPIDLEVLPAVGQP